MENQNQALQIDYEAVKTTIEDNFLQVGEPLLKKALVPTVENAVLAFTADAIVESASLPPVETIAEAIAAMEMEEAFDAEQAAHECPCGEEHVSPEVGLSPDGETMLFDLVTDLQARVVELERRIEQYNVRASHKL